MIVDFSVLVLLLLAIHFTLIVFIVLVSGSESGVLRRFDIKPPSPDRSIYDESPMEDDRRSGTWQYWFVFALLIGQVLGSVILDTAIGGSLTAFLLILLLLFAAPRYKENGGMYEHTVAVAFVFGGALGFILGHYGFHLTSALIAVAAAVVLFWIPGNLERGYFIKDQHI